MSYQFEETNYVNVEEQALKLGCNIPSTLALLPRNFDSAQNRQDLLHEGNAFLVRQLWKKANIEESPIEPQGEDFFAIVEKSADWIGPTIFVGAGILSNNANILSVALGVLSNYLTDFFRGRGGSHEIKISIVYDTKRNQCKKITYQGTPEGLKDFSKVVKEAHDRDQ